MAQREGVDKEELKKNLRKLHRSHNTKRHGVNFYLLLIIVVLLLSLIAATSYFFWRHDEVLEENKSYSKVLAGKESEYGECELELKKAEAEMKRIVEDLNISSASRESLNELYVNLSNVKSRLENDLEGTKEGLGECRLELTEYSDQLAGTIDELNDYIIQYNAKVHELEEKEAEIEGLETTISDLQDDLSKARNDIDDLEDCIEEENVTACMDIT